MKNKILLLTTIYPSPDLDLLNGTNVCHYFAKEWVKLGYEVKVIFNYPVYSSVVHKTADLLGKKVASIGQSYFITKKIKECSAYVIDGVSIFRIPLYKHLPKFAIKKSVLKNHIEIIKTYLEEEQFTPNFIVAHFCYPHLQMVTDLKSEYQAKGIIVNHIQSLPLRRYIGKQYSEYIKQIDVWGFRSQSIRKEFEKQFGIQRDSFMCYSGVPKSYIMHKQRSFSSVITNYIYVGSLIKRKYPLAVLQGLAKSSLPHYNLTFVGEGIERKAIEKFLAHHEKDNRVMLLGNIPRDEVVKKLDEAECFVMISKGESFGLVYLEAMARGLITIASRGEGMENIIEDGKNGFFCDSGDSYRLAEVIDRINSLTIEEKQQISRNAILTALSFSDEVVANNYLQAIIK